MLETVAKLKYGYTFDRSKPLQERCPWCGGIVYRTKEDEMKVFCSEGSCSFHDEATRPHNALTPSQINRVNAFDWAFHRGGAIYLKHNRNYPQYHDCVIRQSDVIDYRYIVREWEPGDGKYLDPSYDRSSRIIRSYSTVEQLVMDGWAPD